MCDDTGCFSLLYIRANSSRSRFPSASKFVPFLSGCVLQNTLVSKNLTKLERHCSFRSVDE